MKGKAFASSAIGLAFAVSLGLAAQKPNFSGAWFMDRDRSFGMPGNMRQTMVVSHTGDQIELETKLIQPEDERTVKDSYVLDGKERGFTPQVPPNAPPNASPPKGKRTANWLSNGRGIVVNEVTTSETPKGPVTNQLTRKWTLSNGELVIDMYIDNPNGSFETKRIFTKK
ncbi:MAG: hypothetical protein LC770_08445 [Acidobacteria bacterium]|nr:hypothetical protein [Acidobacteriota bacterium]